MCGRAHTHTHSHARARAHTHTHTHTDTYTHKWSNIVVPMQFLAWPLCARVLIELMPPGVSSPDRNTSARVSKWAAPVNAMG